MLRLTRFFTKTLSLRISLTIVLAIAVLLTAALFVMFRFSRKALKEEAFAKGSETVEAVVQNVDNILLSVEQTSGNFYWDILMHMTDSDRLSNDVRRLVESNPQIDGAAIAFEPGYFPGHGQYKMFYAHHAGMAGAREGESPIIMSATFGNRPYTEQRWYAEPLRKGTPCWVNPLKNDDTEENALITFSLPLYSAKGVVGILGVDVALATLTDIVLAAKPSPNSYALMLGSDGSFIVHPDTDKLMHHTIFTLKHKDTDPEFIETARAMMAGRTGSHRFNNDGTDCLLFYKPFHRDSVPGRAMIELGWSIGVVYPVNDIFGDYNRLLVIVIAIVVVSLLLLLVLCRAFTHRLLLPLRMLTNSVQRIAEGDYDSTIPDSCQQDEVGRLQDHFQQMQQSLSQRVGELQQLTDELRRHGRQLEETYERAKEGDRMKTDFLHNMTNQMLAPVDAIAESVGRLGDCSEETAPHDCDVIQKQGKIITVLLNDLLTLSLEKPKE